MKHTTRLLAASLTALLLGACATTDSGPQVDPVIVHTEGDAATLLALNPYQATHVKRGARWFPRCVTFTSLGSRTDTQTACLTDQQIDEFAEKQNAQQQEFTARSSMCVGGCGGS